MDRDSVVIVTGAARGIGRHIAHTFAQEGARLALADVEPLDRVTGEVRGMGAEVLPASVDVRNEAEVADFVRRVEQTFGRIDVLVNNAGIVTHFGGSFGADGAPAWPRIRDMEQSFWDRVIETNLRGTFLCTKHVLPVMERQRSGHVLALSGGGTVTVHGTCAYVVSKNAITTFCRYVAEEEREWNVCVVAVSPGSAIATEETSEGARRRLPGPESLGMGFVLAAQVGMELSGQQLVIRSGKPEVAV
jgi:3-oxoacyl-[acyl-carrier protein] reductase